MRWLSLIIAMSVVAGSFALGGASAPAAAGVVPTTTMARPVMAAPTLTNLRVYSSPSDCAQQSGLSNCITALANGLQLFVWTCTNCNPNWTTVFVVNGQASPQSDITLAPSKAAALTVRKNQFKTGDCVAVRGYDPTNPSQNATSNAICSVAVAPAGTTVTRPSAPTNPTAGAAVSPNTAVGLPHNPASTVSSIHAISTLVPTPSGMGITHDQGTCASHGGFGGGLACSAGLSTGMLALIWECNNCSVDGYRLYRVDGGRRDLIPPKGAYSNDAIVRLALLDASSDGYNGQCFAVTAYKGSQESSLSNWACAGAGSVATTVTLSPTQTMRWQRTRYSRTGVLGFTNDPVDVYDGSMFVGYADNYQEDIAGDFYNDEFDRTGLAFDLSSLVGHPISKAVLRLSAVNSWHDYTTHSFNKAAYLTALSPEACVANVDLATDRWWQNKDLNSSVSYLSSGGYMGPDFSIDVTVAVSKWATSLGAPTDFGFILRGDDENDKYQGNTNHVCLTQLQSASLVVTYY